MKMNAELAQMASGPTTSVNVLSLGKIDRQLAKVHADSTQTEGVSEGYLHSLSSTCYYVWSTRSSILPHTTRSRYSQLRSLT